MPSLYLSMKHLPENLPESYPINEQAWGKLELYLDDGLDRRDLLVVEWNLIYFVRWYLDAHIPNLQKPCWISYLNSEESIAQALMRSLYIPGTQPTQFLNTYTAQRSLLTAFAYLQPIPKIYIARRSNSDGNPTNGEISLACPLTEPSVKRIRYQEGVWAYQFDIAQYRQDSRFEMLQFLEEWHQIAPEKHKKNALRLFRQIIEMPEN